MGFPRPVLHRAIALVATAVLATLSLVAAESVAASADGVSPIALSENALPTVQVDGVVWSQAFIGNTVYVAGQFTTARPIAGGSVPRANVLAYNVTTGELISSFVANTNGTVKSITAAPDGSRLYIAGIFTTVDGVGHDRIAALDPSTGAPIASFAASVNSMASGVTATRSGVYVIGDFSQADRKVVTKAAAFDPSNGAALNWAPAFGTGSMRAITSSPDGRTILVGGGFTSVGGSHAGGMAALSASTGALLPWAASKVVDLGGDATGIFGLSGDANYAYAAGWAYRDKVGENSLEGVVSMDWRTGAINWIEDCHGDSYSSSSMNGILYVASHAHFCGNVPNAFGELPLDMHHRATAFSVQAAGVLAPNIEQGPGWYQSFGGQPAPLMEGFFPDLKAGTFTGQGQAAWSVASGGDYVSYGGEFTAVNGQAQTGLVRFYEPATSPVSLPVSTSTPAVPAATPTATPQILKPARLSKPSVVALGPSAIAARWSAPKGASNSPVSGYVVRTYKGAKLIRTVNVSAKKRLIVLSGLHRSTTYRLTVAAKNSQGSGRASVSATVRTRASGKNVSATRTPSKVGAPTARTSATTTRMWWKSASTRGALGVGAYQVRIALHGKTVQVVTVSSRSRTRLFIHLKGHTGYQVSVRAHSWAGWGSWSGARSVRTR